MSRRLTKVHTQLMKKPYRVALRFLDLNGPKQVVDIYTFHSYSDCVAGVLDALTAEVPQVISKAAAIDDRRFMTSPHKMRRYIAERRDLVYIGSPHLTEKFTRKVGDHWIATNIGRPEATAAVSAAIEAAGVKRLPWSELQF